MGSIQARYSLITLNSSQRRMARRLWSNYQQYLVSHPDNKLSRERVMEILVDEPAPEFYITADAARKILRGEIMNVRRKIGW